MEPGHGRRLVSLVITCAIGVSFHASESVQASACATDPSESDFEATHGDAAARLSLVQHKAHTVLQAFKGHPAASSRPPGRMSSSVAASVPPEVSPVATPGALMMLPEASPAWRKALPFGQNATAVPSLGNWSGQIATSSTSSLKLANRSQRVQNATGRIEIEASLLAARREEGEVHPRKFSSRSVSNKSHGKQASSLNTHVMIIGFVLVLIGFYLSFVKVFTVIAGESDIHGDGPRVGSNLNRQENEDAKQNAAAWIPDTLYPFFKNSEMSGQKGLKRIDPDIEAEQAVLSEPRSLQLLPAGQSRRTGDDACPAETTVGTSSFADHARIANLSGVPESGYSDVDSHSTSSIGVQAGDDANWKTENDPSDPESDPVHLKNAGSPCLSETDGTHVSTEDALEDITIDERSCSSGTMREVRASSASGSVREGRYTISMGGQSNIPETPPEITSSSASREASEDASSSGRFHSSGGRHRDGIGTSSVGHSRSSCGSGSTCDVGVSTDPMFVFLRVDQQELGSALLTHRCDVKKLDELKLQHHTLKKERSEAVHELKELIRKQHARTPLPPILEEDRNNAVARTTKYKKESASSPTAE